MSFINVDFQSAFFRTIQERREKREIYGVSSSSVLFDRCLDIILCHDPDIWWYGTGNLLISRNIQSRVKKLLPSELRASEMRYEASRAHIFEREYGEKGFGHFARLFLEYRERMLSFRDKEEERNGVLTDYEIEIFNYSELITHPLEMFSIQADYSRSAGIRRHGIKFDEYRQIRPGISDYQIYDEIEESGIYGSPYELREILGYLYPELFVNRVARELHFEYDTDEEHLAAHLVEHLVENLDFVETEGECAVCYEDGNVLVLPCHISHFMCKDCTIKIIARNSLCPLCRENIA
jgi:hypothetical protein